MMVAETATLADLAQRSAQSVARGSYSMPPDHGAAVVKTILSDENLAHAVGRMSSRPCACAWLAHAGSW